MKNNFEEEQICSLLSIETLSLKPYHWNPIIFDFRNRLTKYIVTHFVIYTVYKITENIDKPHLYVTF